MSRTRDIENLSNIEKPIDFHDAVDSTVPMGRTPPIMSKDDTKQAAAIGQAMKLYDTAQKGLAAVDAALEAAEKSFREPSNSRDHWRVVFGEVHTHYGTPVTWPSEERLIELLDGKASFEEAAGQASAKLPDLGLDASRLRHERRR